MIDLKIDNINSLSKKEKYETVISQIKHLIEDESNLIANLANIVSVLKHTFDHYLWVGFYLYEEKSGQLVLGPFQGMVACTRLPVGKGVCSTAAERKETIMLDDVNTFPGHIACDANSKSEIVVPVIKDGKTVGVLDVDSADISSFDSVDRMYLEKLVSETLKMFD
ncbi:MAG: GAF domain-containing protein [Ignavibacteria bacterium]|nr:GAF domain-containing protein [Ignavibacteria bacterium]